MSRHGNQNKGQKPRPPASGNGPRQNEIPAVGDAGHTGKKSYDAQGQMPAPSEVNSTSSPNNRPEHEWYRALQRWKPLAEIIAIVFAIFYAVVTFLQWRDAHQALIVSARPWIGMDTLTSTITAEAGQPLSWHVMFKNYGASPALHMSLRTRVLLATPDIDLPKAFRELEITPPGPVESTLFNGQEMPNPGFSGYQNLADDQAKAVNGGTIGVVLLGKVVYQDQFGAQHLTTFCRIYNPAKDKISAGMIVCPFTTETAN
jgi:hypothetical protein